MLCPNCMSSYVQPYEPPEDDNFSAPEEPLMECTECEYVAPHSEFIPENTR